MKIVMFSINPIFPDVVTGGASKHIQQIAQALGQKGHQVEIFCSQVKKDLVSFNWDENVSVHPVLPFDLPFPQPYAINGPDLTLLVTRLSEGLRSADRFYIHDGEFLVPDVYDRIPTVSSFRDIIYPETVLGTFVGKADDVISVSGYSADVILNTAGIVFPNLSSRIHQVNNGIDLDVFKKVNPAPLAKKLGVNLDRDVILLHPHRPEPGKGLPETIQVVSKLVHEQGWADMKVLVPEWIEEMVSPEDQGFYQNLQNLMENLGVRKHFKFIPWLPNTEMPALYSMARATLCLGHIVEAFGNVAYESLACQTPSIVSKVGVHRTMMPDNLIDKVHYGDIDEAVACIHSILEGRDFSFDEILRYLKDSMDINHQIDSYIRVIESCEKKARLQFRWIEPEPSRAYRLAPWCYIKDDQIFHDFKAMFTSAPELTAFLKQSPTLTKKGVESEGIPDETWQFWLDQTWLVPV